MLRKNKIYLFLLILITIIPLFDFFRPGLPITHDGQDHVARIANFYQSLSEGNIMPRWAANLNWGYGHPILMFLYPLPSYLACAFHFLSFSLVDSVKIVFGLSFILSGVFMYLWLKEIWGPAAGGVGGLLYMFVPYRFVDLYVRGAIGECWAFVWPPLICWLALKLSKKVRWRYLVGGALSLAALILSHNALSLMFLPIVFGYIVYLICSSPQSKKLLLITYYLLFITLGFGLSAFFWFPAFFEGKYTLRDIVTKGNITGFEPFRRLIRSPWHYGITGQFSVQLGVLQWLVVLAAPFLIWLFWKKKDKFWRYLLFLYFCFWLAIFMMTPAAKFLYFKIPLLQKFQFAWRFLSLAILPPPIFAAALIFLLPKKFKLLITYCLLLIALFLNYRYWRAKDFLVRDESFFTDIYHGTTDTGESAPRWSVRFMLEEPKASMEVIDGEAEIKKISRSTTKHEFRVKTGSAARLVDNTLYFPGWKVFVDGQLTEIQFQDPAYRGLITFWVSSGEHNVLVKFGETRLRRFANLVTLAAIAGIAAVGIVVRIKK